LLARRIQRSVGPCHRFSYPTVRRTLAENARALFDYCHARPASRLNLVGHSLGGLVSLRMLDEFSGELPPGRLVLLGSPVNGSAVARTLTRAALTRPLSSSFLGRAASGLEYGFAHAPPGRDTGVIAGTSRKGAGQLISALDLPHDGTVSVAETRLDGASEQLTLHVSHTGLIISKTVAESVARFLRSGQF
ncbi:MAG: alpha/beta hydrolase, partial [Pseudomonadota bacterium]